MGQPEYSVTILRCKMFLLCSGSVGLRFDVRRCYVIFGETNLQIPVLLRYFSVLEFWSLSGGCAVSMIVF